MANNVRAEEIYQSLKLNLKRAYWEEFMYLMTIDDKTYWQAIKDRLWDIASILGDVSIPGN